MDPVAEWIRMGTSRKIMVAVDASSHSEYAVDFAVKQICRPETDTLVILHVQEPVDYVFPNADAVDILLSPQVYEEIGKASTQQSKELVKKFSEKGLNANIRVEGYYVQGEPRSVIANQVKEMSIDLLLLGSRGMGPIKRAFLGSVSDNCMHSVTCPVLIVRKPETVSETESKLSSDQRTILVGVDRSELSKFAFRWALHEICRPEKDKLVIVASVPTPYWSINSEYISNEMITKMEEEEMENINEDLDELKKQAKTMKVDCEKDIVRGEARESICREAENLSADLLVLGSRGVGKLHRLFLGSVSDYCAHHVKCPILIVKPPNLTESQVSQEQEISQT